MDKKKTELLFELAEQNDGYVSVAEARNLGVAQTYLCMAEEEGLFQKVSKGLYLRRGAAKDPFYELTFRYHKAIFARASALYLHGLTDTPVMEVNLPMNYFTSGIEGASSRHAGAKEYSLGFSYVVTPTGNLVNCYDIERTLIDVLRHKDSFTKEEFLSIWLKGKEKSPYAEKLRQYAEAFHVEGELSLMQKLF